MTVEQATQTKLDEFNRCSDLAWSTTEQQKRYGLANSAENSSLPMETAASQSRFEGLIQAGQNVFLPGGQSIGRIKKLLPGDAGQVSYLVIHTHHWGHYKIAPVELVSDISPTGVWLSIDRSKFQELTDYKTDASIANEIDSALWNDQVLRVTDYHEIDVQVKNGVVSLTGHITGVMNQQRIENALGSVKGILAVRMHLVGDDKLLLSVSEALAQIERAEGNHIFVKVENGVVVLSGMAISAEDRGLAEQCAGNVPAVRGVINHIAAPGVDLDAEDRPFLQPSIGEEIFFHDGLFGFVRQVIINRNNRRVVDLIIEGQFPDRQLKYASMTSDEVPVPDRLAVIPVSVIRYLTSSSGFLLIDSTETTRYQDFNLANFVTPEPDWLPPYPYCSENVRFLAK
ncbi:MAG TPA: BON domain-containing protein [Anaerolineaceae bacterium]|nr:BON domain-containing protein [Anaerolineaceae bacterium]